MTKRKKINTVEDFNEALSFQYFCTETAKEEFKNKLLTYSINKKRDNRDIEVFANDYLNKKNEWI